MLIAFASNAQKYTLYTEGQIVDDVEARTLYAYDEDVKFIVSLEHKYVVTVKADGTTTFSFFDDFDHVFSKSENFSMITIFKDNKVIYQIEFYADHQLKLTRYNKNLTTYYYSTKEARDEVWEKTVIK